MRRNIIIETKGRIIDVDGWDEDKAIGICVDNGDVEARIYLSPNQINKLVHYLVLKLKEIGEFDENSISKD